MKSMIKCDIIGCTGGISSTHASLRWSSVVVFDLSDVDYFVVEPCLSGLGCQSA